MAAATSRASLGPFTAPRVDYSPHRSAAFTSATAPAHFQNYVLFTNYQFYVDEFCAYAHGAMLAAGEGDYDALVEPGNRISAARRADRRRCRAGPAAADALLYHLTLRDHSSITLVNTAPGSVPTPRRHRP